MSHETIREVDFMHKGIERLRARKAFPKKVAYENVLESTYGKKSSIRQYSMIGRLTTVLGSGHFGNGLSEMISIEPASILYDHCISGASCAQNTRPVV